MGRLLRAPDALGPLGDVAHQAQLVVDLVQMAVAPVDVGLRDLADQADHRCVHAVGGEQRGAGIQQAGAGHHGEGLRLAGGEGRAQRHVGRRLFVARMDDAQPLGGVVESVEQWIVMQAGQGVDRVEAMAQEGFDRGFGGRQTRHGVDVQTWPTAIKARGVRLILFALFLAGGAVLVVVLLSWFADRRLAEVAAPRSFAEAAKVPATEVALVLGTAPIGPEGGPNHYFIYRLDAAAALWKAGKVKYFIVSGSDVEPAAMRAGLIERGVPASAIYLDPMGYRTWDSVLRARDVYGQKRLLIVSQRFHVNRALFIARHEGIDAWGFDARDVDSPYSILTRLRQYPAALRAYFDVWTNAGATDAGKKVAIGVDPPE